MTAIHVINCLMLAYLPYFIAYSTTSLKEDRLGSLIAASAGYYLLSQIVQMFLLATFTTPPEHDEFAVRHEILKVALSLLEDRFIAAARQRKSGASRSQKCCRCRAGMGRLRYAATLAFAAAAHLPWHTNEFGWGDLQMAIRSNIKSLPRSHSPRRSFNSTRSAVAPRRRLQWRCPCWPATASCRSSSTSRSTASASACWNSIFLEGGLAAFMAAIPALRRYPSSRKIEFHSFCFPNLFFLPFPSLCVVFYSQIIINYNN